MCDLWLTKCNNILYCSVVESAAQAISVVGITAGAYLAVGYFVGIPLGVAADAMLSKAGEKPLSKFSSMAAWPIILVIVVAAFPLWLHDRASGKRW